MLTIAGGILLAFAVLACFIAGVRKRSRPLVFLALAAVFAICMAVGGIVAGVALVAAGVWVLVEFIFPLVVFAYRGLAWLVTKVFAPIRWIDRKYPPPPWSDPAIQVGRPLPWNAKHSTDYGSPPSRA